MKDNNVIAAILTVAFYTGRGGAMSLPQVLSTYEEFRGLLTEKEAPKPRKKK